RLYFIISTMSRINYADLRGILLPDTTPFDVDGSIAFSDLRANLEAWNKTGIRGHVLLGSTGERVHLDDREYLAVIETARAAVPSDLAFIAGAGQQSTTGTINEIKRAAQVGADAVLVITPYFYRSAITQDALVSFYTAVADASPVPVLLYSMPVLTGIKIEAETVAQLSQHANIIGVKDSSNDVAGLSKTISLCPPDFAVMTGNGTVLLDALRAGATGGILAVGCAAPEVSVEIFRAFNAGEEEHAAMLQSKLTPLATAVTTKYGIGGLKAALDMAGYRGGAVRAPLRAPDESARAEIAAVLESCKFV
ncbi:MAG TPA: dihydrodipicolinate synthase family protein, partial [Pyrinomonadaceae bacterium]|nr:dihydrodipicolinate synthase family protein [Pyrinomonadaceae bacterium]